MSVSLYVPCFNGQKYIAACIEGILEQSVKPKEIIVVNDGSTDNTEAIIKKYPVRQIKHSKNLGLSEARNTGIENATGSLVASLDADCVPRNDWLEKLLNCIEATEAAGVGGKLKERNSVAVADRWRERHMRQDWGEKRKENPPFLFGNNTIFRKNAIKKAGMYPAILKTNFEDVYISEKIKKQGGKIVYEPEAVVEHLREDTIRTVIKANYVWRFFGYRKKSNLRSLCFSLAKHMINEMPRYLWNDVKNKDFAAAGVSIVAIAFAIENDLLAILKNYGNESVV